MSFKKPLPTWKAQGIQPPEHKLEEGWNAQDKPPAGWLNWQANTTYEALKELQENAVDHRDVTSEPSPNGVVRLNEAGRLNEAVFADAEHKEITLKPGVQIVESDGDTPFNFGSVQGRTLVNLLGRKGGCESLSDVQYPANSSTIELDASNKTGGMSSIKVTSISNQAYGVFIDTTIDNTKHYIAMADIKNGTSVSATLRASKTDYTVINSSVLSASKSFQTLYTALKPTDLTGIQTLRLYARFKEGAAGEVGNVDSFRLYEISQTEYDAIATMTPEQVAAKYPYVDSMTNVTNPYAIATGDNLLPPFYEWVRESGAAFGVFNVETPYTADISKSEFGYNSIGISAPATSKTDYVFSFNVDVANIAGAVGAGCYWNMVAYDSQANLIEDFTTPPFATTNGTHTLSKRFMTPNNTSYIKVVIGVDSGTTGSFKVTNPMLAVGSEPKPFKPQSRSMWAAECQLAADPADGTNADVLFTGDDGLPYVLEKWKKVTLDGSFSWRAANSSVTGLKVLAIDSFFLGSSGISSWLSTRSYTVKYDGSALTYKSLSGLDWTGLPDYFQMWDSGTLYISVPNKDSGWGDAYTPTAGEIKAYFLGWRMALASDWGAQYNGTGEKIWIAIGADASLAGATTLILPVAPCDVFNTWQPYRLQYLKVTPTVEPVRNYETGLTLCAGSNVVEVGSGIVIRENANPSYIANYGWYIADKNRPESYLAHAPESILYTYRNQKIDLSWEKLANSNSQGYEKIKVPEERKMQYDPTAVYHVTYTMLDPTLSAPINGTVATNLRGTVSELVQRSGDVERRLSVVENQKAEKDNTVVWISPALLNGWTNYGTSTTATAGYTKIGNVVNLKGRINGTTTADGTILFMLPEGYRPKETLYMNGTWCRIEINANGRVSLFGYSSNYITIDSISFIS